MNHVIHKPIKTVNRLKLRGFDSLAPRGVVVVPPTIRRFGEFDELRCFAIVVQRIVVDDVRFMIRIHTV